MFIVKFKGESMLETIFANLVEVALEKGYSSTSGVILSNVPPTILTGEEVEDYEGDYEANLDDEASDDLLSDKGDLGISFTNADFGTVLTIYWDEKCRVASKVYISTLDLIDGDTKTPVHDAIIVVKELAEKVGATPGDMVINIGVASVPWKYIAEGDEVTSL